MKRSFKGLFLGGLALIIVAGAGRLFLETRKGTEQRLREALAGAVGDSEAAGVLHVVTPNQQWELAQGKVDIAGTTEATVNDRFRIGSTSKTFVAVVTLQLAEEGGFGLDDRAAQWLPETVVARLANADTVTIRQLLQMRSGIPEYLNNEYLEDVTANPYDATRSSPLVSLEYAYGKEGLFAPGANYRYTNSNYLLLQLILEEATGQPLHQLVRERILDPVGMANTYSQLHETLPGEFVHGYTAFAKQGESWMPPPGTTAWGWATGR